MNEDSAPIQTELPLPFPEFSADLPLLPARMVNEYQYCPRLAYLMWVQGEWAESADTVDGRRVHRRVDKPGGNLPPPEELEEDTRIHARSIELSSNRLGYIARMDLVEGEDGVITPVDYKRSKRPHIAKGVYEPEQVQLCIQGLILREHGYVCEAGVLYYAASRERVRVPFDDELIAKTRNAADGLRLIAAGGTMPPPLIDSPKCPRCSLVGICLPDEVNYLNRPDTPPRALAVVNADALPLYVQARGAKVSKTGETLEIYVNDEKVQTARLGEVSQLVLQGAVYVTAPALTELMYREIPITWTSFGGWFYGHSIGVGHKNVELRTAQYRTSFDDTICLRLARGLVAAKIRNQRTQLRRNWKDGTCPDWLLDEFRRDIESAERARDLSALLGFEGNAAARYFRHFREMLRKPADTQTLEFDFAKRNRRPPTDPINAMLSYGYSLLTRSFSVTLSAVGFDPYRGYYHQPRYGRPALSLDLMEPFRPLIADSTVIQVVNNGEIRPTDFIVAAGSVNLTDDGRKRFIAAFERRMAHEVTHPLFGYKVNYRRLIELQSRLLGRFLLGEIRDYPNFTTR